MINFVCTGCKQPYTASETQAGDPCTCRNCGQQLLIPLQSQYTFDETMSPIDLSVPTSTTGSMRKMRMAKGAPHGVANALPPSRKRPPGAPQSGGSSGLLIAVVAILVLAGLGYGGYALVKSEDKAAEERHQQEQAEIKRRDAEADAQKAEAFRKANEAKEAARLAAEEAKKPKDLPEVDRMDAMAAAEARADQLAILGKLTDPPPLIYESDKKLFLTQPHVFPLLATPRYQVLAAGSRTDSGRFVLFGAGKLPLTGAADPDPMLENVVTWLANKTDGLKVAVYKDLTLRKALSAKFEGQFIVSDAPAFLSKAADFDVLVIGDATRLSDLELNQNIPELLSVGRGVLATSGAFNSAAGRTKLANWGYVVADCSPEHAENKISDKLPMELNSIVALDQFKKVFAGTYQPTEDEEKVLSAAMIRTLQDIPSDDRTVLPIYKEVTDRLKGDFKNPRLPMSLVDKVRIACMDAEIRRKPLAEQGVHPASVNYPGRVSTQALRENARVRVNLNIPYLNSTGYYAAPGDLVEIEIPESALSLGLIAQIGINMTVLNPEDDWHRAPDICRKFPLRQTITQIANPYGGPIYISVPDKDRKTFPPPSSMAVVSRDFEVKNEFTVVDIRNAVKMPRWIDGQNNNQDWEEIVAAFMKNSNHLPPMLEIEAGAIILTLPTKAALEAVDRPGTTTEIWIDILDECKVFTGRDFVAPFPLRVATDAIKGTNNSAYPIDMQRDLQTVTRLVDRFESKRHPSNDVIGAMIYFFLGKSEDLPGKTAAMRLLFSSYLLECTSTYGRYDIDSTINKEHLPELYTKILNSNYRWNTATTPEKILPYLLFVDDFGWMPLTDVVGEYSQIKDDQWPSDEEALNADFAFRLSKRVNRNLLPYFKVWGWRMPPKRDPAELNKFPVYMPDFFPDSYLIIQ